MGTELSGKVAIVTGGASGIGRATAQLFAEQGAKVVVADVAEEEGEALATGLGEAVAFRRTDVSDAEEIQALVDFAVDSFGGLHVMVNNAGVSSSFRRFLRDDLRDFDRVMAVNLFGVVVGTQRAGRHMAEHGGGSIINTVVDRRPHRGRSPDRLPHVQGVDRPLHPHRGHRSGRVRDPGELHRSRPHPDRYHQLRPGPHHRARPTAAAAGESEGCGRGRALSGR